MITVMVVAGKRALLIHYRTKPTESLALTSRPLTLSQVREGQKSVEVTAPE
jgi:hypothetical protein